MVALIGDRRDKTKIGLASVSAKWLQLQTFWSGNGGYPLPRWGLQPFNAKPRLLVALHCIAEGGSASVALQREGVQVVKIRSRGECDPSRRRRNGRAMFGQLQREREGEQRCKRGCSESRPRYSEHQPQPPFFTAHSATRYLCPSLRSSPVSLMTGFKLVA